MECLVLSPSFMPMAKVPWQRAVTLYFKNLVEVVEHHDAVIRSVTLELKVPSVVRFIRGSKPRRKAIKFSRENVYARDAGRCQYCSRPCDRSEATYDHVIPRAQGGGTHWDNIVIACVPCNQKKGGRTPEQAGMHLRTVPVKPKKLPDTMRFCMTYQKGMPLSWRQWLQVDLPYWHGALEEK
jgi:5-methylcytosine-specific restriction endonuclease McrA